MNKKQALRRAVKYAEELEDQIAGLQDFNKRCSADIRGYVGTIQSMIAGGSPCESCEEHRLGECEHKDCEMGNGCDGWWLRTDMLQVSPEGKGDADEIEGVLPASSEG